ncbi:MAG: hypothetical protein HDR93_08390 [Bacteroides sp.]|nr:hypothetical protein [Bacteroides sp.]
MKQRIFLFIAILFSLTACIEDGFDTRPSAQPSFSVEELDMGVQFTENPSPTAMLMIYNRNSKQINLSQVNLRSGEHFRINVDGRSGSEFRDVEIRPNDSIYVFVECTLPVTPTAQPLEMTDMLDVITNGVTRSVPIKALAQNVARHRAEVISGSVTWTDELPHVIFDTLRVAPGATLTLAPGAALLFHDKAALKVEGTLLSLGTAADPVILRGDRTGNVVADISYDVMSAQWHGVDFARGSSGNRLSHTEIVNTVNGVTLDSLVDLTLENSRVYNSASTIISARGGARIRALGSELSNAASALLLLEGGDYQFFRSTLANWYLFSWPDMAIVEFLDPDNTHAEFANSIIYGRDTPVGHYSDTPETADIWFRRVCFDVEGSDDARFLNCLWATDPQLSYDLKEYTFTYLPAPESPIIQAADPSLDPADLPASDRHGRPRALTLGALAPAPE